MQLAMSSMALSVPSDEVDQDAPTTLYVTRPPRPQVTLVAAREAAAPAKRRSRRWLVDLTMTAVGALVGVYLGSVAVRDVVHAKVGEARVALHVVTAPAATDVLAWEPATTELAPVRAALDGRAIPSAERSLAGTRVARRLAKHR